MRTQGGPPARRRILLALDSTSSSPALLRAAVQLATQLEASVEGFLIEDINLLRLIGRTLIARIGDDGPGSSPPPSLPGPSDLHFARQISRHSPRNEAVDVARIEREMKIQARRIEQMLSDIASHSRVDCTFRTVRGLIDKEIRAAAEGADLLALWGARRSLTREANHGPAGLTSLPSNLQRAGQVLIISCQSTSLPESLLRELIRGRGRRVLFMTA